MRHLRWRRGFTITEMLTILGLIAVAGLLISRLFAGSMRAIRQAPAMQDRDRIVESIEDALRRDLWRASQFEVIDPHSLEVSFEKQESHVRWRFADGILVRDGDAPRRFATAATVAFSRDGESLDVTVGAPNQPRAIAFSLVAARRILEKTR